MERIAEDLSSLHCFSLILIISPTCLIAHIPSLSTPPSIYIRPTQSPISFPIHHSKPKRDAELERRSGAEHWSPESMGDVQRQRRHQQHQPSDAFPCQVHPRRRQPRQPQALPARTCCGELREGIDGEDREGGTRPLRDVQGHRRRPEGQVRSIQGHLLLHPSQRTRVPQMHC